MHSTTPEIRLPWIGSSPLARTSLWFVLVAAGCLIFADLEITASDPWPQMRQLGLGLVTPYFGRWALLGETIALTVAFAVLGTFFAALAGLALSLLFHLRLVRVACAVLRSVHELFWALIFLQIFGLTALTGTLAIAIPYTAICAKVFAEILEESEQLPAGALPPGTSLISAFFYARLPNAWAHIRTYTLYRFECALRSSAVLGFIGLPTLGFHLESAYKEGHYSELSALLLVFFVLIGTVRLWMRPALLPLFAVAAYFILPEGQSGSWQNALSFFLGDIVPYPLRGTDITDPAVLAAFWAWLEHLLVDQALPGVFNTIILTQIALVGTGMLTLVLFPLVSSLFMAMPARIAGHGLLVALRSTPEYVLAFILLQLWGPSMLPAVIALSLHNGAIIGHLIGNASNALTLRPDAAHGLNLYAFEAVPRLYRQFLAFLFYRWEVIMRETAILGMLGVHTLGFFVDSAFADIRFDRALVLIAITALLNIAIDMVSRRVRRALSLQTSFQAR